MPDRADTTTRRPCPALINLLVPAGTLLGWGTAPAQATGWGLLDTGETQALAKAASRHPRTRWCVTVTGADGTAIAHGCAAGQHPWHGNAPPPTRSPPDARTGTTDTITPEQSATPEQLARLRDLLERLNVTFEPVARDTCDHSTRREQVRPQPQAQAPRPRPQPAVHRPRLQRPGHLQRPRPHRPPPRRPHRPVQPQPQVPPPPPRQASPRLERHPAHPRHNRLDHPVRPHPRHDTDRLRPLTAYDL